VSWAIETKGYSQRHACGLVDLEPKTFRYVSKRSDDDAVRRRLRELALERSRFGYRRLYLMLRREGVRLNRKKLYRLYREERLMVRKRGGRKRALGTRAPMAIPQSANQRWSLDFVSDALTTAASSAFLPSSMTSAGNVWRSSSTTRCQEHGLHANSAALWRSAERPA